MTNSKEESDLTQGPIKKLIRQISLPVVIGFFFNTMFNVADTYFAGKISPAAIAALSLSFPVFFLIIIFDAGISTGTTAVISNALGSKVKGAAEKYTAQAISFGLIVSAFITVVGLFLAPTLFKLLGAKGEYLNLSLDFIDVIFSGSVFFLMISVFNSLLQSRGNTRVLRNFLIVGFLLNVIFDPWFLFGGFGVPPLGIKGIGFATVLVEAIGTFYIFYRVARAGLITKNTFKELLPERKAFGEIVRQAVPASINLVTIGAGIFIITYFISSFGENAVAAYGIATRVEQIALLPTIGLTIACLTIIGQNNGAKNYARIKETYRLCLRYGISIIATGGVLIFLFSKWIMLFFTQDAQVVAIGAHYLKIAAFISVAYAILSITVSALQGMKRPMYAVWIGLYRQIVAPFLLFSFLANILGFGLNGIWWGIFITTWSGALFTFFYGKRVLRRL